MGLQHDFWLMPVSPVFHAALLMYAHCHASTSVLALRNFAAVVSDFAIMEEQVYFEGGGRIAVCACGAPESQV
jgi:hypothetical protein